MRIELLDLHARMLNQLHPERNVDHFTHLDGTIKFYSFVRAIFLRYNPRRVLNFGPGRGAFTSLESGENGSRLRRHLQDLRYDGARVVAADIDSAVTQNEACDERILLDPRSPLPFADDEFDVIVSDFTFEHLENPGQTCQELRRVCKDGGFICARTANGFGYVRLFASLFPNRLHGRVLGRVQPNRRPQDIFATTYRLYSVKAIRRVFPGCDVYFYRDSAEPAYFFGNSLVYRSLLWLHKLLPPVLATTLCVFVRVRK